MISHEKLRTGLLLGALGIALLPGAANAQTSTLPGDLLPWLGCWQLDNGETATVDDAALRQVCMEPGAEANVVRITTRVDEQSTTLDDVRIDGLEREVAEEGCAGVESAFLSSDGRRIFNRAELSCGAGLTRIVSGVSFLAATDTWVDVQAVRVDDEDELIVRRYRYDAAASRALLTRLGLGEVGLAASTARTAAARKPGTDELVEAVDTVDAAVVQAWLVESGAQYDVNAALLMDLADAEVPASVIDLVVALSFPDYFQIGESGPEMEDEEYREYRTPYYPAYAYGYYSPAFVPFGWGYYGRYHPVRVVHSGRFGGRVLNGQGYTRVRVRPGVQRTGFLRHFGGSSNGSNGSNGSSAGKPADGGSSSSSSGKVSRSGYRRGGR